LRGGPKKPRPTSKKALASLLLGLITFVFLVGTISFAISVRSAHVIHYLTCLCLVPVAGLLAVIFGHQANTSIRITGYRLSGKGMAAGGLALAYLGLVAWVAILIFVVPEVDISSPKASAEAAPVGWLRTINTAAVTYMVTYKRGYPPTLSALGPPKAENSNVRVEPSEEAAGLIDKDLATGTEFGYRVVYIPGTVNSTGRIVNYGVHADPVESGAKGDLHYYTDQSAVIRVEEGKEADQGSQPIE
jgi:hypothetical protein